MTVGNATAQVISQNHTHIVALAPGGKGSENPVWLSIDGQERHVDSKSEVLASIHHSCLSKPANAFDGEMLVIEGTTLVVIRTPM